MAVIALDGSEDEKSGEIDETPGEPTPDELRDYILDETELTSDELDTAIGDLQQEIQFLSDVAAYYLIAMDAGLTPAEFFGTRDYDTELDLWNIQPEMNFTTSATIIDIAVVDPEETDWTRQDIQLTDDSGTRTLVLWNDDVRTDLSQGDDVRLVDCWAKEYKGDVQLSLGKNGRIEQL